MKAFLAAVLLSVALAAQAQFETAVDLNAPINTSTGATAGQIQPAQIARLGLRRVRLNAILGPWNSPGDATLHSGRTWYQAYDQIVNDLRAQGIEIYMLVGAEAVKSASGLNTSTYVSDYAANFREIVGHFRDRVTVYESFNEPNDWAGGSSAQVEPRWFAYMLQEIWMEVKHRSGHAGDPAWQVTLVSGPLFTHDLDTGASYWQQVRQKGVGGDAAIPSLNWANVLSLTGSYPYDGIGFHIYVREGSGDAATIATGMNTNLNATWSQVTALEGAGTAKKIWVSECGWRTDYLGGDAEAQARNVATALGLLRADSRVRLGTWFCLVDFGAPYGVYNSPSLADSARKAAWFQLRWETVVGSESGNLSHNAGFEAGSMQDWTPFGTTDGAQAGTWFGGITARSGSWFCGAAANFGAKNGGAYQRFHSTPGQRVRAGARIRTYREGGSAGNTTCRIGIDPSGGTNPAAASVVWSEALENQGSWRPLCVEADATANTVTVFLRHDQSAPTWNVSCFDDVAVLGATAFAPLTLTAFAVD